MQYSAYDIDLVCGGTGAGKSVTINFEWLQRHCLQIRNIAKQLVPVGPQCSIECDFTNQTERNIFVNWAEELGYPVQLHYINVDKGIRWQRVQKRNAEQAETFQLEVARNMFNFFESIWEPSTYVEMTKLNGVQVTD